tara:strand:+ start:3622 stop:4110 length:489 start_codon:yes stop_codon:yes gene_type:complete
MREFFKINNKMFSTIYIIGSFVFSIPYVIADSVQSIKIAKDMDTVIIKKQYLNDLLPMPKGDYNSSYLKVSKERNPFNEISISDAINIENVYESIKFKGVAKSKDIKYAIIESNKVQQFYQLGDVLDNGFIIKSISIENTTVDITNGIKDYRLSLVSFSKKQ